MLPHGVCVRLELCGDGGIIDDGQECARERRERENGGGRDTGRGCSGGSSSSHQSCTVEIPNADKYRSPKPPANPVTFSLPLSSQLPLFLFLLFRSSSSPPPAVLLPLCFHFSPLFPPASLPVPPCRNPVSVPSLCAATTMSTEKPLPFIYQFAAGAVAGVSEVCISTWSDSA